MAALDAAEARGRRHPRQAVGRDACRHRRAARAARGKTGSSTFASTTHAEPLLELRRLLRIKRAYLTAGEADRLEEAGRHERRDREAPQEAIAIAPELVELRFWTGITMAGSGDLDGGCELIAEAVRKDRRWLETHTAAGGRRPARAPDGGIAIEARLATSRRGLQ